MKILLLGVGMQGKAALYDMVQSPAVEQIVAADVDLPMLQSHVAGKQYGDKVQCEYLDAADDLNLDRLMDMGVDVVIDLLPPNLAGRVAAVAVRHGLHLINTNYARPELKQLAAAAEARGVTILPEFGMDPGIDLVMLGDAVRSLDSVEQIWSYGSGIPEAGADDNALRYKVSWTFAGVLRAYHRGAQVIREGRVVDIPPEEIFALENIHEMEVKGVGWLEAFPNGDASPYLERLGIDKATLREVGRYTLRWPGHCHFWNTIAHLHLLDEEPVLVDGVPVDRQRYLAAVLEPQLQYKEDERDLSILCLKVAGQKDGRPRRLIYQVVDRRDLSTGLTGMSRTVGFTVSIGAQMIGAGLISRRGLLSPVTDVPYETLEEELRRRGVRVTVEGK